MAEGLRDRISHERNFMFNAEGGRRKVTVRFADFAFRANVFFFIFLPPSFCRFFFRVFRVFRGLKCRYKVQRGCLTNQTTSPPAPRSSPSSRFALSETKLPERPNHEAANHFLIKARGEIANQK